MLGFVDISESRPVCWKMANTVNIEVIPLPEAFKPLVTLLVLWVSVYPTVNSLTFSNNCVARHYSPGLY
jgi:hypothetical protein